MAASVFEALGGRHFEKSIRQAGAVAMHDREENQQRGPAMRADISHSSR